MKAKTILVISVLMLLISTATAVPISAVKENKNIEPNMWDIFMDKWFDFRGLKGFISGADIIQECYNAYNDTDVQSSIVNANNDIKEMISECPYNHRELLNALFDVDNSFDLDSILYRIKKLDAVSVLRDVHSLLQPSKTYKSFNESRNLDCSIFLTMFYPDYDYNEMTEYYPIINDICKVIAKISLLWAVPLAILFGVTGIIISSLIAYVFFSPITVPMSLYVSLMECAKNGNPIWDEIIVIALQYGLVGVFSMGIPLLLKMLFMTEEGLYGLEAILYEISILSVIDGNVDDWSLVTGENNPDFVLSYPSNNWKNVPVRFVASVSDSDEVVWGDTSEFRDYVKIGFDWDNDMIFDEWSDFNKPSYDSTYTYFEVLHTFKNEGSYKINVIAYDICGAYSKIKTYNVEISNPRFWFWKFPMLNLLFDLMTQKI